VILFGVLAFWDLGNGCQAQKGRGEAEMGFSCGAWLFLVNFATKSVRTHAPLDSSIFFATSRPPNSPQHMRSLKFRGDMFLRRLAKFVKSRYSFVTYPTFAYYYTATKQLY
jgi:hypothetical protein